ncbi:uncharacterized protein LOC111614559 [Centruroides sculpturatus]|uniref:uncharacterized protein LOC111614559 n=1 Tax=Centruroides sculpturatus TaxID=218467 RepID=UPI000C6EDAC2|nr:uncharacterized protein LOC111614559 [Centruroides sculpturatus]
MLALWCLKTELLYLGRLNVLRILSTVEMNSKSKSKAFCCVPNCNSKAIRDPDISFHVFPHEKQMIFRKSEFGESQKCNRRKEWIRLLRIGKKVTKYMVVCSKHFTLEDYILSCMLSCFYKYV